MFIIINDYNTFTISGFLPVCNKCHYKEKINKINNYVESNIVK